MSPLDSQPTETACGDRDLRQVYPPDVPTLGSDSPPISTVPASPSVPETPHPAAHDDAGLGTPDAPSDTPDAPDASPAPSGPPDGSGLLALAGLAVGTCGNKSVEGQVWEWLAGWIAQAEQEGLIDYRRATATKKTRLTIRDRHFARTLHRAMRYERASLMAQWSARQLATGGKRPEDASPRAAGDKSADAAELSSQADLILVRLGLLPDDTAQPSASPAAAAASDFGHGVYLSADSHRQRIAALARRLGVPIGGIIDVSAGEPLAPCLSTLVPPPNIATAAAAASEPASASSDTSAPPIVREAIREEPQPPIPPPRPAYRPPAPSPAELLGELNGEPIARAAGADRPARVVTLVAGDSDPYGRLARIGKVSE